MKKTTETDIVRACLDWLALHKIWAWRCGNGGVYDPVRKCFRTFHGLKGVSDILGVLEGGITFACECKRPGEKLRPDQAEFLDNVRRRGGLGIVVTSVAALETALREEGVVWST